MTGGLVFAQIIAGGFIGPTCGVTGGGKAYCWGENEVGDIGDGTLLDPLTPSAVAGGRTFSRLDAGFRHTCGPTTAGILYCWGSNRAGQLGVNSTAMQISPARVVGQPEP